MCPISTVCVLGMLLRFFMNMYDQEIIEEEAFLHWKEEVNDEYPGKGKALFQVRSLAVPSYFAPLMHPPLKGYFLCVQTPTSINTV